MQEELKDAILTSRLDAINEAQKRARLALFISSLAAGTIIAGLWNAYLSWDLQWTTVESRPEGWGQEQLIAQQIRSWIDSNTVGVSLLGIRLSVSDAAVLGSIILLILSFYYCMCMRRENHEIGSLLLDSNGKSDDVKRLIFYRIRSFMVFNTTADNDAPYRSLANPNRPAKHIRFARFGFNLLNYLPALTVFFVILSDVYFSFWYASPWRRNTGSVWSTLSTSYRIQLVSMDIVAFVLGLVIFSFCKHAVNYHKANKLITDEFNPLEMIGERINDNMDSKEGSRPIVMLHEPAETK